MRSAVRSASARSAGSGRDSLRVTVSSPMDMAGGAGLAGARAKRERRLAGCQGRSLELAADGRLTINHCKALTHRQLSSSGRWVCTYRPLRDASGRIVGTSTLTLTAIQLDNEHVLYVKRLAEVISGDNADLEGGPRSRGAPSSRMDEVVSRIALTPSQLISKPTDHGAAIDRHLRVHGPATSGARMRPVRQSCVVTVIAAPSQSR